ncbi:2Fe-2S iron-sulfur cluster-binding protein [Marivita sp. S6314]|uniref:2Fe-2S iron-sulfur cluster-binding protein n=1 Tax=Marivita sp. S6314 TaxID=2926406 RepID=UPI001FF3A40A|nr:2Fe-2S iron-sulfur cluster-binding protein [Marivita sp. S6314]MCK0151387.1 2Fe-2S iron-sulfur cluster-binding protein [Marivita sp. S6314]
MTSFRMPTGGLIDRTQPISFTFDGTAYQGFAGDTLASALLANGVRVMGRSFKYHRPRSVWGAWVDEPNAIMTVSLDGRDLPNCLATTTPLEDGMQARSVNAWPSAQFDIKGGLDLFHRWLAAGFYYKTFIWPDWHLFEPSIRRMAGLGAVSHDVLDGYMSDQIHDRCDVLVVGGGPAGLVAAVAAAQSGQQVVLVDDHPTLGGSGYQYDRIEDMDPQGWVAAQVQALTAAGGRLLRGTTAFGVYDHGLVGLAEAGPFGTAPRLWRMRADRIILASGALDRQITFANNDRPGVMSLFGAAEYLARYGVMAGRDIAVLSNHSFADRVTQRLTDAGARIVPVDPVTDTPRVIGVKTLKAIDTGTRTHPVDTVLVSGGVTPLVHLWRHAGGKLDWCDQRQAFVPGAAPKGMVAVGAANGTFDLEPALEEARGVGAAETTTRPSCSIKLTRLVPKLGTTARQWIDLQHDVTLKDIEMAARENYVSVEHLKRYTTLGMASDQGKTSNMAGLAAMAAVQDVALPEVGTTTFRPPFVPIPLETYHGRISGELRNPVKRLPLEARHRAADAALCEYGGWLRPGWYGSGDPKQHIQAEAKMARETAGILDGSPLGKIEVMGPDAEAFLNFVYYNTIRTMKPGQIRYGFMLTEGGIVYDDGVVSRVGQNRFIVSCSSSHVDGVRAHLEAWRQDGNDPDRIFVHDLTQHWATVTVTGPKARDLVGALGLEVDLSAAAFPHMTFREARFHGHTVRIARVSFSGDLCYEMSIRASQAERLWDAVVAAGQAVGAAPIGIEAMSILRAEKGYIIIGKDTDGETMPHDLGVSAPRDRKTAAYIGDRSLQSETAQEACRKTLVGLAVAEGDAPLVTGAHAITTGGSPRSVGYVTSSYFSPFLGHPVAMGLIEGGAARIGETIEVWHDGERRTATLCAPCFYDPDGGRLHAG